MGEGSNQINLVQTQTRRLVFYAYLGERLSPFHISYCIAYAAAFTARMSLEALLVLADMIVSNSHGAGKKVADPG